MYSSIETAPPCKLLEQSDHYSWRYYISKNWGIQKCRHECSLGINLIIDNFFVCIFWYFTPVLNFKTIGQLLMEILHLKYLGDTKVSSTKYSLGVNLVIDNFCYVASDTSPLYQIWKQSNHYLWRYCILKIWGIQVSFGCERSCFSSRRVSNFNSKVPQGGYLPTYKIWKRLNIVRVRVFTSSVCMGGRGGSGGGGGGGGYSLWWPVYYARRFRPPFSSLARSHRVHFRAWLDPIGSIFELGSIP